MKVLWCWRCREELPRLDEEEFVRMGALFTAKLSRLVATQREQQLPREEAERICFRPALDENERLAGRRETNHLALHRTGLALYGPPCGDCG